jgi:NAD(P)-dependent dehydrogenase (short-subunit alcohol dehydrogenase family)
MTNLTDRTAIVTGAAGGLGAAMALGLAGAGARVVLTDIADPGRTGERIRTLTGNDAVATVVADVSRYSEVAGVVAEAKSRFGSVDIIVNNAGIGAAAIRPDFISRPIRFWEIDPALWTRMLATNANGPFHFEHAAIPGMVVRGWGRVINVTTTFQTMLSFDAYGPSKAALEAHSHIAAHALSGTGVTVNVLIPGGPADTAQVTDDIGVPRSSLLPPSVMVAPLLWLCSDEAHGTTGRRFNAANWNADADPVVNVRGASRPLAWPELIQPIVVAAGSRLGEPHVRG